MEFSKALREIRANRDAESHFQWILACLKKQPRRRLQVRAFLAKSRSDWRRARAAHFAEMAGDLLWTILKKPMCAEIVYRYALTIADDPLPSLMALFEIAEKQKRVELAYEIAKRISEVASPIESETFRQRLQALVPNAEANIGTSPLAELGLREQMMNLQSRFAGESQADSANELRNKCFALLFESRPDNDEFQRRIKVIQWWLATDAKFRDDLLAELRAKARFQLVIAVLSLCVNAANQNDRKELLMQLGYTYRFGVGELHLARDCFQKVVDDDPDDREAWGELLELLSDLDDSVALSEALQTRIEASVGLEKRELQRQHADLLRRIKGTLETDEQNEPVSQIEQLR